MGQKSQLTLKNCLTDNRRISKTYCEFGDFLPTYLSEMREVNENWSSIWSHGVPLPSWNDCAFNPVWDEDSIVAVALY